ncbi:hypothetical protein B0T24DRAFT_603638 [Lasiosphaeria ovina]|uniref:Uncharacterized protein n=1 Tax=Lasiosphaeria ovina TaxID=92902 RepID=A0AAE0NKD0_9PEZI|nr:hypothetical protein B0T24DRAFT_603638 [Lasiosphaeria ovina]
MARAVLLVLVGALGGVLLVRVLLLRVLLLLWVLLVVGGWLLGAGIERRLGDISVAVGQIAVDRRRRGVLGTEGAAPADFLGGRGGKEAAQAEAALLARDVDKRRRCRRRGRGARVSARPKRGIRRHVGGSAAGVGLGLGGVSGDGEW